MLLSIWIRTRRQKWTKQRGGEVFSIRIRWREVGHSRSGSIAQQWNCRPKLFPGLTCTIVSVLTMSARRAFGPPGPHENCFYSQEVLDRPGSEALLVHFSIFIRKKMPDVPLLIFHDIPLARTFTVLAARQSGKAVTVFQFVPLRAGSGSLEEGRKMALGKATSKANPLLGICSLVGLVSQVPCICIAQGSTKCSINAF